MADSFTIQISSNLVNRLSGDENKIKKKTKKPKEAKVQPKVKPTPSTSTSSSSGAWPLQSPMFLPVAPPPPVAIAELEAIRSVLQESERVVEKLEKQESNMLQELNQRAKDLRDTEFKLPYQNPIPCTAEREGCLQCYKEHANDPLKCAQVVKNFADCARQARQRVS